MAAFAKLHGAAFYQHDKENMQRFPPTQGLTSARKGSAEEVKKPVAGEGSQPDLEEAQVRHSVLKGLWFPIMNNLTNLIMERRKEVQEKSSVLFFKILNNYSGDFSLDFWREILNQIVLPLLEDIHLAVEIPSKK